MPHGPTTPVRVNLRELPAQRQPSSTTPGQTLSRRRAAELALDDLGDLMRGLPLRTRQAVHEAREAGVTDRRIAEVLGVDRQTLVYRYGGRRENAEQARRDLIASRRR